VVTRREEKLERERVREKEEREQCRSNAGSTRGQSDTAGQPRVTFWFGLDASVGLRPSPVVVRCTQKTSVLTKCRLN